MFIALLITAATAASTCESTVKATAQYGTFTDGSKAAANYDHEQDRCWLIAPTCPDGDDVVLTFDRLAVEPGYDWVQVFDAKGRLLSKSATVKSEFYGSAFTVWFHSDETTSDTGFSATYTCETLDEEAPVEDV